MAIDKQQRGFQSLQRNALQPVNQGYRLPLLHLLEKSIDRHAIPGFEQLIRNLPVFIGQRQRFTIKQKARSDWRQGGNRVTDTAQLNAQAGIRDGAGATAESHNQSVMQTNVASDAEILIIAGDQPVVEELLYRRRPRP